jgi:predicted nucleotidyltransferase
MKILPQNYPIEKLKKEILTVIGKYLDLNKYKIFFFGSRVSGKGDDRSDIDVGILGPEKVPFEILAKIKSEISEIKTLYKIDVVDFDRVSENFKKVALQNIEYIYE